MKKRNMAALLAAALMLQASGVYAQSTDNAAAEGSVFNIYAWSEKFRTIFEKYYAVPEGVTVNWTIVPKVQGRYMDALDKALLLQDEAPADQKIDLIMADPDYLMKYVSSDVTQDITQLGVTDFTNAYEYTVQACTDENGQIKGAGVWLHPGVAIYRRSYAQALFGSDDPQQVKKAIESWDAFRETAALASENELYMTPSYASTFLSFAEHMTSAWVDETGTVQLDEQLKSWINLCSEMIAQETTLPAAILDDDATEQALAEIGRGLFFFGTDDYINNIMWQSQNNRNAETTGDWYVCMGPAGYTDEDVYLLAASGTDNPTMAADVINTFLNQEEFCMNLGKNEHVFTNNKAVNDVLSQDPALNNEFLGGQNPFGAFIESAEHTEYVNRSYYDALLQESLLDEMQDYCSGTINLTTVMKHLEEYIGRIYPTLDASHLEEEYQGQ